MASDDLARTISGASSDAVRQWWQAVGLGLQASAVVGLRVMKIASVNPTTHPVRASLAVLEINRMVGEKALTALQVVARAGSADPLEPMRAQISANRTRLGRRAS